MRVAPATDPLAELARLRRPTGPRLHMLDGAPADARQLGWILGRDGVAVRVLRGHCLRTVYGLFDEAAAALQLPGDPVEDWAGLGALLTDMSWLPGDGHVLVVTRAALLLAAAGLAELAGFVGVVREVARGRAEEGDPVPFHVVFQDDTVGLAVLRARLDLLGARFDYDELSGWDAEEPAAAAVPGGRSGYSAGDPRPDGVDRAVTAALSARDDVVELRRGWEEFRGPSDAPVRVYAPVVSAADRFEGVAATVAAAAAALGAVCTVVPLPPAADARDGRQAAVAAAAATIWPAPPVAAPAGSSGPAAQAATDSATAGAPAAATSAAMSGAGLGERAPAAAVMATGPGGYPAGAGPAAPASADTPSSATPRRAPAQQGARAAVAADAGRSGAAPSPAPAPSVERTTESTVQRPADDPAASFELVAANLEWVFDPGAERADPVEEALLAATAGSPKSVALFRTWVRDPDDGWVRVVMVYLDSASAAEVEAERGRVVEALQRGGARRCCVEIVGGPGITEAHRWVEGRSVALRPLPAEAAADAGVGLARRRTLPADAQFAPGPGPGAESLGGGGLGGESLGREGLGGEGSARLVDWAAGREGVLGLVTAWTETGGERVLVVGVVVTGDVDQEAVRAEAAAAVDSAAAHLVVPFAPAAGLAPVHLRLYRGSTRLWTRTVERPASGAGALDTGYRARTSAVESVLGPVTPVTDEQLPGGFTIVGLDLEATLARGPEQPDERDSAVAAWVRAQEHTLAVLRAVTPGRRETLVPVYAVLVDAAADVDVIRRGVAEVVAGTGADRCAVEVFCPFQQLSVFHVRLYGGSVGLWKTDRPRAPAAAPSQT